MCYCVAWRMVLEPVKEGYPDLTAHAFLVTHVVREKATFVVFTSTLDIASLESRATTQMPNNGRKNSSLVSG